jgi:hypothetical protein
VQRGGTALSLALSSGHWHIARWLIDELDVDVVRRPCRDITGSGVTSLCTVPAADGALDARPCTAEGVGECVHRQCACVCARATVTVRAVIHSSVMLLQVAGSVRWRRLRRDWLQATVCISNERATVVDTAAAAVTGVASATRARKRMRSAMETTLRTVTVIAAMLRDYRMLAHDDGEGRPLRCMSLYGGMVTKML